MFGYFEDLDITFICGIVFTDEKKRILLMFLDSYFSWMASSSSLHVLKDVCMGLWL